MTERRHSFRLGPKNDGGIPITSPPDRQRATGNFALVPTKNCEILIMKHIASTKAWADSHTSLACGG